MATKNKTKNLNKKIVVKSISVTDAIDEITSLVDDLSSEIQTGDITANEISDRLYQISDDLGDRG
jgi:hypothetical protein